MSSWKILICWKKVIFVSGLCCWTLFSVSFYVLSVPPSDQALGREGFQAAVPPKKIHQRNFWPLRYTKVYEDLNCICIAQCPATARSPVYNMVNSAFVCVPSALSLCLSPIEPHTMGTTTAEALCSHFDYIFSILLHFFFFLNFFHIPGRTGWITVAKTMSFIILWKGVVFFFLCFLFF